MTMESRIDSLLNAVLYKREKNRSTINGAEQDIIRNAENFRLMNAWSDGKAEKIVRSAFGWMQKQEPCRVGVRVRPVLQEWCADQHHD